MEALLKLPLIFKGLILAWVVSVETTLPDANVVLNLATIVLLVVFGPRYIRSTTLKRQIEDLRGVVQDKNLVISSKDEKIKGLESDMIGCNARAEAAEDKVHELKQDLVEYKARYDEMSRYTAEPAFIELKGLLENQNRRDEHWQAEMVTLNNVIVRLLKKQTPGETPDEEDEHER